MNFKPWLDKGDIQKVRVTRKTLDDLEKLVERDIKDSQVKFLSADRRSATAFNAALNLANYRIRKNGYRVAAKAGHHRITFSIAGEILGKKARKHLDYYDVCRRKRNKLDYDLAGVVSESEVAELIEEVMEFKSMFGVA